MSSAPKLFVEQSGRMYYPLRLEEREYARAIQSLVFVCTDIGIIDVSSKMIYLARRALRPASGWWWFIGGRSRIGETEYQSAQRCFERETGLLIAEERFNFVCMNRYFFKDRQQEPREAGCDSLCYTLSLHLTDEERARIILDPHEYLGGGLQAFDYEKLQSTEGVQDPVRDFYIKAFD
ncbi:MAG: NUDIX domain-containing protein [bacterium]|nr:NUDIX domain-containing protein [bacterium]